MQLFFLSFFYWVATKDIIHTYTVCLYNVYGRNTTLFAGRILYIILNQAVGWTKFGRGLDLAPGPDFGHACSTSLSPTAQHSIHSYIPLQFHSFYLTLGQKVVFQKLELQESPLSPLRLPSG